MIRPVYELSIDPNDAQDGEYLGFWDIANTATPAIEIKGIAFSKVKELFFKDDLKYRIAAPVLVPGKVFRRDEETGEEYYVNIKPEVVEQMFMKFQQDRAGKQVFNDEHNESERIPSFILETWLVETPETDKSFVTYGIKCPPKTIFAVQQFTDKDAYHKCVEEGKTGFSIHGSGALKLNINKPISMSKQMKKRKFVAHFSEATETDGNEIIVTADELVEGAEVVVVDENFQPVDGFSGEVTIDDQPVVIEGDIVKSIGTTEEATEEVEMTEETTEDVSIEMEDHECEKESESVEMEEVPVTETYTKEELDAKFDEIYALIAEAKAEAPAPQADIQMSAVELSGVQLRMSKLESISKFLKS